MTTQHLAVVTLHDAAPAFSKRIFEFTDAFENLGINFNVAAVPFFHHTEDLSRFPDFVDKLKSYKRCEIVLHGLYHEDRDGQMDDFHTKSKGTTEEELRAGLEIFEQVGIKTSVFIPPQWKLSSGSIEVLEKLGFSSSRNGGGILPPFPQAIQENKSSEGVKLGLDRTSRSEYCEDRYRGKSFQTVRRCTWTENDQNSARIHVTRTRYSMSK